MVDRVAHNPITPIGPARPAGAPQTVKESGGGQDFASQLRQQLEHVSQMQHEADKGVQNLLTGQSDNITEAFVTARKAEVAFSLLMEIRNKLTEAYSELRQLRV